MTENEIRDAYARNERTRDAIATTLIAARNRMTRDIDIELDRVNEMHREQQRVLMVEYWAVSRNIDDDETNAS